MERAKRCGSRSQPANPDLSGGAVRPLVRLHSSHSQHGIGVVTAADPTHYDLEMDEAARPQEVDLVDVEMVDDFLPRIPTITVSIRFTWSETSPSLDAPAPTGPLHGNCCWLPTLG